MSSNLVPRELPVIGPPHLVREAIQTQIRQGRLVTHPADVHLVRRPDGMVSATVTVLTDQAEPRRVHPLVVPLVVGAVGLAMMGGIVFAIGKAVSGAAHHPGTVWAVLLLASLGTVLALTRRARRDDCPGVTVHCGHRH